MIFKYYSAFMAFAVQNLCLAQIFNFYDAPAYSPPNFEPIDSFRSFSNANVKFQPALSAAAENSDRFGKPTFSFPRGNDFSGPTSTADTSAASSFETYQPSTIPASLDNFISTFTNAVHTSPVLSDLLDFSSTSLQSFGNFVYQSAYDLFKSLDVPDPREVATYLSQPLTESFEILTYPMFLRIEANSAGKQLLAEGILKDTNAVKLALALANEMETSAKQIVQKNDPKSKFGSLKDGFVNFLKSQGLYTAEKMLDAGRYFVDEVKLAGKRFGISGSNYASANV